MNTTISSFKNNVPAIKSIIKKNQQISIGTQSALDIIAVANGFSDYNTAKGITDSSFYLKTNVGSDDSPHWIGHKLPYRKNKTLTIRDAEKIVNSCDSHELKWVLFLNEKSTGVEFHSKAKTSGSLLSIKLIGNNYREIVSDAKSAIKEIIDSNYKSEINVTQRYASDNGVKGLLSIKSNPGSFFQGVAIENKNRMYGIISESERLLESALPFNRDVKKWSGDDLAVIKEARPKELYYCSSVMSDELLCVMEQDGVKLIVIGKSLFIGSNADALTHMKSDLSQVYSVYIVIASVNN